MEFGYHDENCLGGLESSQFRFQQEYSTGVRERQLLKDKNDGV